MVHPGTALGLNVAPQNAPFSHNTYTLQLKTTDGVTDTTL